MGFLNWLKGKPKLVTAADRVWMNDNARRQAVGRDVQQHLSAGQSVILLAHFRKTLEEYRKTLSELEIPHTAAGQRLTANEVRRFIDEGTRPRVMVAMVKQFQVGPPDFEEADSKGTIPMVVAERHLLRKYDEEIIAFAEGLGRKCTVTFHVSLDDPLCKQFAGDWVRGVLQRLGMAESEAIESAMVARRIQAAQVKLEKQAQEVGDADSAEEWFQRNLPGQSS